MASSCCAHWTGRSCSSVDIIPDTRRVIGSRGLSQEPQKAGILGRGMVTPQKRPKVIMMGGLRRFAMNALGVSAATICPTVIAKNLKSESRFLAGIYLVDQDDQELVTGAFRTVIEPRRKVEAEEVLTSES